MIVFEFSVLVVLIGFMFYLPLVLFKVFIYLRIFKVAESSKPFTIVDIKKDCTVNITTHEKYKKVYSEKDLLRKIPIDVNVRLNYV